MDSTTRRSRGQAVVEVTIVIVTVLLLISAAIALTLTLRREIKHNFIKEPQSQGQRPEEIEDLKDLVRLFPKAKRATLLENLEQEGWQEDRRLKIPSGLIVLLNGPKGHMGFIDAAGGPIGIYY